MLIASTTDAIITAGGGILGAVAGTLAAGWISRNAERGRQKAEGAAAWRLLRSELGNALDAVHGIRADGAWPIGWYRSWSIVWQEVRRPLFMSPPADVDKAPLDTVERACFVIGQLESAVNERRPEEQRPLMGRDQIFCGDFRTRTWAPRAGRSGRSVTSPLQRLRLPTSVGIGQTPPSVGPRIPMRWRTRLSNDAPLFRLVRTDASDASKAPARSPPVNPGGGAP